MHWPGHKSSRSSTPSVSQYSTSQEKAGERESKINIHEESCDDGVQ